MHLELGICEHTQEAKLHWPDSVARVYGHRAAAVRLIGLQASMDESELYRKSRGQKKIEWAAHQAPTCPFPTLTDPNCGPLPHVARVLTVHRDYVLSPLHGRTISGDPNESAWLGLGRGPMSTTT